MRIMITLFLVFLASCKAQPWDQSRMQDNGLPRQYEVVRGGNLFSATAEICGTNTADEAGRGRWRRWLEADERLARAPLRRHSTWGTIAVVQPGVYTVPHDLCEDEAASSWGWFAILALIVVAVAILLFRDPNGYRKYGPLGVE